MENIYTLSGRYADINHRYEVLSAELAAMYEENGGEETADTMKQEALLDEIAELKDEVLHEIVEHDDYAAIAMNKDCQRKMLEAELKTLKEEQAKVVAKYQARINRLAGSVDFWKENFAQAMKLERITKIGGPKTGHKFTVWVKETQSVDVDEETVLAPYRETIDELLERLPAWVTVKTGVSKTELKKEETLPEGATLVTSETIQIR